MYPASRVKGQLRLFKRHKRIKTICPVCRNEVRSKSPRVIIDGKVYHLGCHISAPGLG